MTQYNNNIGIETILYKHFAVNLFLDYRTKYLGYGIISDNAIFVRAKLIYDIK